MVYKRYLKYGTHVNVYLTYMLKISHFMENFLVYKIWPSQNSIDNHREVQQLSDDITEVKLAGGAASSALEATTTTTKA